MGQQEEAVTRRPVDKWSALPADVRAEFAALVQTREEWRAFKENAATGARMRGRQRAATPDQLIAALAKVDADLVRDGRRLTQLGRAFYVGRELGWSDTHTRDRLNQLTGEGARLWRRSRKR